MRATFSHEDIGARSEVLRQVLVLVREKDECHAIFQHWQEELEHLRITRRPYEHNFTMASELLQHTERGRDADARCLMQPALARCDPLMPMPTAAIPLEVLSHQDRNKSPPVHPKRETDQAHWSKGPALIEPKGPTGPKGGPFLLQERRETPFGTQEWTPGL